MRAWPSGDVNVMITSASATAPKRASFAITLTDSVPPGTATAIGVTDTWPGAAVASQRTSCRQMVS